MSAFGGIVNFGNDPRPIDKSLLVNLGRHLDRFGPDGGSEVTASRVGMSYRAFCTTWESRFESQPLLTSHGHMLAWNGRLDNRSELLRQLRNNLPNGPDTVTDLDIVLAAYLKWGEDCFVRLLGDFCLSLWDEGLQLLYLARDVVGVRTLYFNVNGNHVCWSTHLAPLLQVFRLKPEIEEEYIAGHLTRAPEPGLTPYK
ncbi:MAG TPA: hypothetical protein VF075_03635, partial [Pyrinomonadaceae bacterium]